MSVKPEKEEEEAGVSSSAEFQDPPLVFSSQCCFAVGPPAERNHTLAHSKWIRSGPIAAVLHVSGCWFDLRGAEVCFCFCVCVGLLIQDHVCQHFQDFQLRADWFLLKINIYLKQFIL